MALPVSAGERLLWELLVLTLPHLWGLMRPVGEYVMWGICRGLGSALGAEQPVAADMEVSLSLSCSISSGIRWDFRNLQS